MQAALAASPVDPWAPLVHAVTHPREGAIVNPRAFVEFLHGRARDSHHRELARFQQNDSDEFFSVWCEIFPQLADSLFKWERNVKLHCEDCGHDSAQDDSGYRLALSPAHPTLKESMVEELARETLHDYTCDNCKKKRVTRIHLTKHLPNVLVMTVKRYIAHNGRMLIPLELTANNNSYVLYGVVKHVGNLSGGHYTAVARDSTNGQWFLYDDARVTPLRPEQVTAGGVYMLFYDRVGSK
jgi:ubiquitin C-terminal hydrolase